MPPFLKLAPSGAFIVPEYQKVRTPIAKHFIEFGANELRAKDFSLEQTKFVKRKSVDESSKKVIYLLEHWYAKKPVTGGNSRIL